MEQKELTYQMIQPLSETESFYKLKRTPTYDPIILLLDIYQTQMKTYVRTKSCIRMLVSSFIHNSPQQETTKYSSTRESINKYIYYNKYFET